MSYLNLHNCYIIAEIGINHNGDINLAKKLIHSAKESGANAVKFQTYNTERLVSQGTPKVSYQEDTTQTNQSHYEMLKSVELKEDDHHKLFDYANNLEIDFFSTPYDIIAAKFLYKLGVSVFKTASADIVDLPLHNYLASTKKDVIISTGMATEHEVMEVLNLYNKKSENNPFLLHCVSNYPCSDKSINLNVLNFLKKINGNRIGYSDHSTGNHAALGAVILGARIIEKHFTLDKNMKGPDHKASSTPQEFNSLVQDIRRIEMMIGTEDKILYEEEKQMREVSRKSIFLKNDVNKDQVIEENDLTLKRPGTGLYSKFLSQVIGKRATTDLKEGEMVTFDKLY